MIHDEWDPDAPDVVARIEDALTARAEKILCRRVGRRERLGPDDIDRLVGPWHAVIKQRLRTPVHRFEIEDRPDVAALATYAVEQAKALAAVLARRPHQPEPGTRPVVGSVGFILSAPRSGSTLLRVMLAGHPELFCPPELHLIGFSDMRRRRRVEDSTDRNSGLSLAVSHLYGISTAEAEAVAERWEDGATPVAAVFEHLVAGAAPRMLIDKSPGNARSIDRLETIHRSFDKPKILHLVRHPVAVVDSLVRNRFNALMSAGGADPYELAERVWLQYNGVIEGGLPLFPAGDVHMVMYEQLVRQPEATLREVCQFLGVHFHEDVLHPYRGDRMRGGGGDLNLADRTRVEPDLAGVHTRVSLPNRLNPLTVALAERLGYSGLTG